MCVTAGIFNAHTQKSLVYCKYSKDSIAVVGKILFTWQHDHDGKEKFIVKLLQKIQVVGNLVKR